MTKQPMGVNVGDPVEVRFATQDGYLWNPAVVTAIADHKIGVAFPNGTRKDLERGIHHYRRPERGAFSPNT